MTSLVAATFLLGAIFSTRVNGITTKTLPSVLNNSSDSAQFVQVLKFFSYILFKSQNLRSTFQGRGLVFYANSFTLGQIL